MSKYTDDYVLKLIYESNTLKNIYDKSSDSLKLLFTSLIKETLPFSDNQRDKRCCGLYAKEMEETSFRLAKEYSGKGRKIQNYCMYTLRPSNEYIIVDLRTDGIHIESSILNLANIGDYYNGGREWHRFIVRNFKDLNEAVKLISKVYHAYA